ncbi:MAG: lipoyl synthase [Ilumatobacteraceae bacterium]
MRVRWLGRVNYRDALALQEGLFAYAKDDYLLMQEHHHVFTHGASAELDKNLRCTPSEVGAELVRVNRGGDITYHGPGQLVVYPIRSLPGKFGDASPADVTAYVCSVEQLVIDSLAEFGIIAGRKADYPGVWLDADTPNARKICAIGVRVARGATPRRTMHGFALNIDPDMRYMREHIVPCGIDEWPVTSLREEGSNATLRDVADVVARLAVERWGAVASSAAPEPATTDRVDVAWEYEPDAVGLQITERKPEWLRPHVQHGAEVLATKKTLRDLRLVTVCEEAGCPNVSECWRDGTATFMVLGERCTRACGFCLVDTRKPEPPTSDEPRRVAEAVSTMGLQHAVLTMVARDDLPDGGFAHVAECIREIRTNNPSTAVETLVSDAKGDDDSLQLLFAAKPDVFNHNIETVARLQRVVRPSAGYARSLSVLARARRAGLVTKSGFMLGLGEERHEVESLLADLASVGVSIVTIGQYLRPTSDHLPVTRWASPDEFAHYRHVGQRLGITHVEASPLTRSSYHAKRAAGVVSVAVTTSGGTAGAASVGAHALDLVEPGL